MGRYDGEEYEPVPKCRSGEHSPAPNGFCFRCNHRLTPTERKKSRENETAKRHVRHGCPSWCAGPPSHKTMTLLSTED